MIIHWFARVIVTIIVLLLAKFINKNIQPIVTKAQILVLSIIGLIPVVDYLSI